MTNTKSFCEALDRHLRFPSYETAFELLHACGGVWNETSRVPTNFWTDIEDAISNLIEFKQWEVKGRTYAGAARRIRPALKQEYSLS